jgi:hypothetical protein
MYGIIYTLYDPSDWGILAQALQRAEDGDGSDLLSLSDGYLDRGPNGVYDNEIAALSTISCVDQGWNTTLGALRSLAPQAAKLAPYFGVADLYSAIGCLELRVKPASWPETITAPGPLRSWSSVAPVTRRPHISRRSTSPRRWRMGC